MHQEIDLSPLLAWDNGRFHDGDSREFRELLFFLVDVLIGTLIN